MTSTPTVTVAIPVLNEEANIDACLDAVSHQTYRNVVEVLVVDGGSTDRTREVAARRPGVRVIDNPRRIQAAALNIALTEAKGEVFVRVDGHCLIASDYVERCVEVLSSTGAAMVGGSMAPVGRSPRQRGIAAAMSSRIGAGPARFHTTGPAGWVDTVYLGAYRVQAALEVGGYAEDQAVNEDAELAVRMRRLGGIRFDSTIRSTYHPRDRLTALARQYFRYGAGRAATIRKHPSSIAFRQLAPLGLLAGLASPWRRPVARAYILTVLGVCACEIRKEPEAGATMAASIPTMHLCWAAGLLSGLMWPDRQY